MHLSADDLTLIRSTMAELKANAEPASTDFYDRLFTIAPDLRPMFSDDLAGQGMKFMSTLSVIVDSLDDETALSPKLTQLGQGHRAFGVGEAHYAPMRQALIETMRAHIGSSFTPEAEGAWGRAYDQMAERMLAAA